MATESQGTQQPAETAQRSASQQNIERRPQATSPARHVGYAPGPFSLMRRFNEDMDRLFSGFFGSSPFQSDWLERADQNALGGWPQIEVHHAGDKLIVQADIPGLKREDVSVDVHDNELRISGERRSQTERNEGRYYRTERSYGSFSRVVPLPEGAKTETASASFENGVLRVEIEAPATPARGRRIEVREGHPH
jgi:HSP20 family protein